MNKLQITWAVLMAANVFFVLPGMALDLWYDDFPHKRIGKTLMRIGLAALWAVAVYATAQMFLCAVGGLGDA